AATPTHATLPRAQPGCRRSHCERRGLRWTPDRRCWFRCRAAGMCPRWPARVAAPSPVAGTAPARCPFPIRIAPVRSAGGAVVVGARRTAEELGRAFPGSTVVTSGGDSVVREGESHPAFVVATPGAEPLACG